MKQPIFLCLALLFSVGLSALQLTQENKDEISMRWQAIFDEQIDDASTEIDKVLLRNQLLAFEDADVEVAAELIAYQSQGSLWDAFVQKKDRESVIAYLTYLTAGLQRFVGPECNFVFPVQLDQIRAYAAEQDINIDVVCTRARQAFLAFTIIVSKMNYIAQQ